MKRDVSYLPRAGDVTVAASTFDPIDNAIVAIEQPWETSGAAFRGAAGV